MQDSKRETDIKNRLLYPVGEGESGMIWENNIETCILPYVKQIYQSKFDAWNRALKASALGQLWGIEWGVRWKGDQNGGHMYTHGWFMSIYGKNHYNIVK